MQNISFDNFLRDHLTVTIYESLPELLIESRKMTTMILAKPQLLSAFHIGVIAEKLMRNYPEMNSQYIIDRFVSPPVKALSA